MSMEDLVVQNADWLRKLARRYHYNTDDADDLASETIYKCLSSGRRFDASRSFRPWAKTIMENTYITFYNRRRLGLFIGLDGHEDSASGDRADQRASIRGILSVIRECGRKSCCIECVVLYAKGYSYEEIASMLGILPGTVKSRVAAGRKMLRDAIG